MPKLGYVFVASGVQVETIYTQHTAVEESITEFLRI